MVVRSIGRQSLVSGGCLPHFSGDDVEYALHICHSCRLLTSHTKVFHAALATRGDNRPVQQTEAMVFDVPFVVSAAVLF